MQGLLKKRYKNSAFNLILIYHLITSTLSYAQSNEVERSRITFDPSLPAVKEEPNANLGLLLSITNAPSELEEKVAELESKTRPDLLRKELDKLAAELNCMLRTNSYAILDYGGKTKVESFK